ncbi:MerR family transcriptional regulator [Rhizobiaceae bacterium n13]|uniref:MerR family transcriptional regulator n=1 Tax=Ferirhizobium litorale TaxID=2927786 RepID=A0AAE3QHA2_9HYPH|nr:MerR family transcriptional regulator [Fererhizobium litorale]MDI7863669.1 MerR family transcriptional regulator [Fererhizobium litorale]MDI7923361.1 MerR family transcriptional regulator [Fererhizobium litorale]
MPDASSRHHAADDRRSGSRTRYRYLPATTVPPELPSGPIAIADMANAFGVTHRTLHFYEEKGLLSANRVGLMRVYSHQAALQMAVVNACREVGMPVAVIQELMDLLRGAHNQEEADEIFRDALLVRRRELLSSLSTIRRQMQQISELLERDEGYDEDASDDIRTSVSLTPIERHCLDLMAKGYTTARLANALDLTPDELRTLEADVIRKFNANNRFQAVAKAVLLGLVDS